MFLFIFNVKLLTAADKRLLLSWLCQDAFVGNHWLSTDVVLLSFCYTEQWKSFSDKEEMKKYFFASFTRMPLLITVGVVSLIC